jgi:hypothetical protein
MAMRNDNEKIWLITNYTGLVQENSDVRDKSGGTMEIKSLDIVKQYSGAKRKLIIAVKVTDKKWNPIPLAEVGLFVAQPKSNSVNLYRYTDSEGIAFFEIDNPNSGMLNAGVTSVKHPCYISDTTKLQDKWRKIRL